VSGITFFSEHEILITTNDSRLRLINIDDGKLKFKYKGHKNENLQIQAHPSHDDNFILSPSEDGLVYIWNSVKSKILKVN